MCIQCSTKNNPTFDQEVDRAFDEVMLLLKTNYSIADIKNVAWKHENHLVKVNLKEQLHQLLAIRNLNK